MIKGPITAIQVFHWSLAAAVTISWLAVEEFELWHEYAGYIALALITWRIVWVFAGPKSAGLGRYRRGARKAVAYSRELLLGRGPRPVGAFPFASLSVVLLFVTVTATGVSGWLVAEPSRMAMLPDFPASISLANASYADDKGYRYYDDDDDDDGHDHDHDEGGFGSEAMEEVHEFLANFLLLVIFVHVVLMIYLKTSNTNRQPNPPPNPTMET